MNDEIKSLVELLRGTLEEWEQEGYISAQTEKQIYAMLEKYE